MAKIIGIISTSFTPKDSSTSIEGKTFYVTEPINPLHGEGYSSLHFFLTKEKLASLTFTPAVNQHADLMYNRFGKVQSLHLIDETAAEVDF